MPEHLALWALKHLGPRAATAVARLESDAPETAVIERQTRVAVAEGAVVGGPFIVLVPVAWCAALLAQAQLALELAALAGRDPTDQMRAADLLVLQRAYGSTEEARAALARVTAQAPGGSRVAMVKRMAYMLGLIGGSDARPSRLRVVAGWVAVSLVFLVGLLLPLVWVPYMAVWMRKSTLQLGARAQAYYATGESGDTGVTVRAAGRVQVGLTAGLVRWAFLIVLPVAAGLVALATSGWANGILVLLVLSFAATCGWIGYHWWRASRAHFIPGG
jgi:hypothetical protein